MPKSGEGTMRTARSTCSGTGEGVEHSEDVCREVEVRNASRFLVAEDLARTQVVPSSRVPDRVPAPVVQESGEALTAWDPLHPCDARGVGQLVVRLERLRVLLRV